MGSSIKRSRRDPGVVLGPPLVPSSTRVLFTQGKESTSIINVTVVVTFDSDPPGSSRESPSFFTRLLFIPSIPTSCRNTVPEMDRSFTVPVRNVSGVKGSVLRLEIGRQSSQPFEKTPLFVDRSLGHR